MAASDVVWFSVSAWLLFLTSTLGVRAMAILARVYIQVGDYANEPIWEHEGHEWDSQSKGLAVLSLLFLALAIYSTVRLFQTFI